MRLLGLWLLLCGGCFDFESLRERTVADLGTDLSAQSDNDLSVFVDMAVTGVAACPAALTGGTHMMTMLFAGAPSQIALTGTSLSGVFESEVLDNQLSRDWSTLSWTPTRPFGKPLPGNRLVESGYAAGNANMLNNVLLLHLDEQAAGSYTDASGRGRHGDCALAPSCPTPGVPGRFRRAQRFLNNQFIRVANHADLEPVSDVTIAAWVRVLGVPAGDANSVIAKGHQPFAPFSSYAIEIESHNNAPAVQDLPRCYFAYRVPTDMTTVQEAILRGSTRLLADTGWHHVACTFSGTAIRLYVDGVEERSVNIPAGATLDYSMQDPPLTIGSFGGTVQNMNGEIDEVAVFNQALSSGEIGDHYRRGAVRLRLQVRSCDDPACTGRPFQGPDATPNSSYTESCAPRFDGTPSMNLNHIDCDGDGDIDDSPATAVLPGRYLQYRAQLDRDQFGIASPELRGVSICP
jgi:hypothetical protein